MILRSTSLSNNLLMYVVALAGATLAGAAWNGGFDAAGFTRGLGIAFVVTVGWYLGMRRRSATGSRQ